MFFNTHFPRISAVQLQQPRLHWVVGALFPTGVAAAGRAPTGRAYGARFIPTASAQKKYEIGNEP